MAKIKFHVLLTANSTVLQALRIISNHTHTEREVVSATSYQAVKPFRNVQLTAIHPTNTISLIP